MKERAKSVLETATPTPNIDSRQSKLERVRLTVKKPGNDNIELDKYNLSPVYAKKQTFLNGLSAI